MLTAQVKKTSSGSALFINNKVVPPVILHIGFCARPKGTPESELSDDEKIGQAEIILAKKQGINLVSITIAPPWSDDKFSKISKRIQWVLDANPDAKIILRFQTDEQDVQLGSDELFRWYPDILQNDSRNGSNVRVPHYSVHSERWRERAYELVRSLVEYYEKKENHRDSIAGYHVCAGVSNEWFYWVIDAEGNFGHTVWPSYSPAAREAFRRYLKKKYGRIELLREKWETKDIDFDDIDLPTPNDLQKRSDTLGFRDPVVHAKAIDFDEFQNFSNADALIYLCQAIKDMAPSKLAIAFYGYHFERQARINTGHLALMRVLRSPDIDVLCAPYSYGNRGPGEPGYLMSCLDSVLVNNKLWLTEDDTRTHLLINEDGTIKGDGVGQCFDIRQTRGVLIRNFSYMLTRGGGLWWGDMACGGVYNDEAIWETNGKLFDAYKTAIPDFLPYRPEIAIIADERSRLYLPQNKQLIDLVTSYRNQYWRIGAPIGIYQLTDLVAGNVPKAKMYIFIDTFRLDSYQINGIREQVNRPGCMVVWQWSVGVLRDDKLDFDYLVDTIYNAAGDKCSTVFPWSPTTPTFKLREYAASVDVHIYNDDDCCIAAGNSFVSIHATSTGTKRLNMPYQCCLTDILNGGKQRGRVFDLSMDSGDTKLFRITHYSKSPDEKTLGWEFDTDGNTEDWFGANHIDRLSVSNSSISGTITGNDPQLFISRFPEANADIYQYLHVRMKVNGGSGAAMYFGTLEKPGVEAERFVSWQTNNDDQFHEYKVRMSRHRDWTGWVNFFRFDVIETVENGNFQIDYIRLSKTV